MMESHDKTVRFGKHAQTFAPFFDINIRGRQKHHAIRQRLTLW